MTPRADMDVLGRRFGLDLIISDVTPVGPQEIHRQNAALDVLVVGLVLAIDLHDGPSIATHHSNHHRFPRVLDLRQLQVQIPRQRVHVLVDRVDPQRLQRIQPVPQTRDAQEVDRSVLEPTARPSLHSTPNLWDPTWKTQKCSWSLAMDTVPPPQ